MSYSSWGEADGGKVASCAPAGAGATFRICGGGIGAGIGGGTGTGVPLAEATALGGTAACCGGCEPVSAIVDRSSGAPAARPPGAPTGGALSWIRSGAAMTA